MSEEFSQVLLRMPAELKRRLQEAADESSRSLTAECNVRLQGSLARDHSPTVLRVGEIDARYRAGLNEAERALLDLIRAMSPERQGALLTVLKR